MPPGTVFVGRGTKYATPYRLNKVPERWYADRPWTRAEAVWCYEMMVASGWRLRKNPGYTIVESAMVELEDKDLACDCREGLPCHADILLKYANMEVVLDGSVL